MYNEKLEDEDAKLEEELVKGTSLASKVMGDLFKKQAEAQKDAMTRKQREQEEITK